MSRAYYGIKLRFSQDQSPVGCLTCCGWVLWLGCRRQQSPPSYSLLSVWGRGGQYLAKRQKTKQRYQAIIGSILLPWVLPHPPFLFFQGEFSRLIPVSRGRRQCRVLWLLEQLGLALEGFLNTETRVILFCKGPCTVLSAMTSKGCGFSSRANSCLVSFAVLFSAQAGSRAACFSRDCLSKCVLCSVFMLEKERSKPVL